MSDMIAPEKFHRATKALRSFFEERGYVEVHTQNRLSILAACEDPSTVSSFEYQNVIWPLPQTGQMWLEHELLKNPSLPGVFCLSTSYRNEKNPIPGRHNLIFPMFEFESRGSVEDLRVMERELCEYLGFGPRASFKEIDYKDAAAEYGVNEIEADQEIAMCKKYGNVVMLQNFPVYTSPFWNMKMNEDMTVANKIDVLIHGMETIGSAERSSDKDQMHQQFYTISDGGYAKLLFDTFGKERVEKELNEFLSFDFFPRFGGGIGITRMIHGLEEEDKRCSENAAQLKLAS
jgi:aspartyl/asparaginyl-tRNA synthetase